MEHLDLDIRNSELIDETYSSMSAEEIETLCEKAYEDALAKHKTADNPFPKEASDALQACRSNPKKWKRQNREGGGNFWSKLGSGLKTGVDVLGAYGANQQGQNLDDQWKSGGTPPPTTTDEEVRILGMKPLVFTVVALGVVIAGGIGIAMISRKAGKK
jgi:hypothetical protein